MTIETCRSCLYCVGLSDNHVDCLYCFRFSKYWGKYPFPEFQPIKENLVKQIRTPFYGYQNNYSYQKKKSYGNRYKSKKGKYKW